MAIGEFYAEVIFISLGAAAILYAMVRRCTETIQNFENSLSHEGYIIQSHIWVTDVKDAVEEVYSFIQRNISESESKDKYIELFSDKEKISPLRNRLNRLNKSYNAYLDLRSLFPNLIQEHEESKRWLIRTMVTCFAFASWGATGVLIETEIDFFPVYKEVFWFVFCLLLVMLIISVYKITYHNRKCGTIRATIRTEKTKYGDIIEKVA